MCSPKATIVGTAVGNVPFKLVYGVSMATYCIWLMIYIKVQNTVSTAVGNVPFIVLYSIP